MGDILTGEEVEDQLNTIDLKKWAKIENHAQRKMLIEEKIEKAKEKRDANVLKKK